MTNIAEGKQFGLPIRSLDTLLTELLAETAEEAQARSGQGVWPDVCRSV